MHPELFTLQFGNLFLAVKAYSFFYSLATIVVVVGTYVLGRRRGFEKNKLIIFLLAVSAAGFLGARLLHFLTNLKAYISGEYDIFSLDMEGFAISGGIIAALFAGSAACRKLKIDLWKLGDTSVIFLGIGIALARIGCFLNGCCFGKKTDLPWGVQYPSFSYAHRYQLSHGAGNFFSVPSVHPAQLYEALAGILGSILAIYLIRKKFVPGSAILSFGIWFCFFRLINMQLRVMPESFDVPDFFYPALYVWIMIICILLLKRKFGAKKA